MAYTNSSNFAKSFCKKAASAFKKAYKHYDTSKGSHNHPHEDSPLERGGEPMVAGTATYKKKKYS